MPPNTGNYPWSGKPKGATQTIGGGWTQGSPGWQSTNRMSGPPGPPVHRPGPAPAPVRATAPIAAAAPVFKAPAPRVRRSATSGGMANVKDTRLIRAMTPR